MKIRATDYNGTETDVDIDTPGLSVIVHDQGIAVEALDAATITPEDTLSCIRGMNQVQWEHISQGEIFKKAWQTIFDDPRHHGKLRDNIPASIGHLQKMDRGVQHIAGLIITLLTESMIKGTKKIFVVQPETYVHPSEQRSIVCLVRFIQSLPPAMKLTKENAAQDYVRNNYESDKADAVWWLMKMPDDKRVGMAGDTPITAAMGRELIAMDSKIGRALVAQYVQLRDGNRGPG